jgi:inosose dehydratase
MILTCLWKTLDPVWGYPSIQNSLSFAGGNVEATTRGYGSRVKHVHFKFIRREVLENVPKENMSFLEAVLEGVFKVPVDGFIDFMSFAQVLVEAGYSGWIVFEDEKDPEKWNRL